jgi:hypothetical protein
MEDRLKAKDLMIEKLELKNQHLKSQRASLAKRLSQKEEMSDCLHVVDFDQLKIENQQYLERVDEKNSDLLRVKATTGHSVQVCLPSWHCVDAIAFCLSCQTGTIDSHHW